MGAANKLDKNKKTMISQAITAFPLIHFNSDGSTGERTGNTSMQRAALGELGRYMGKEVDIHPFAMTGKDMSGIALDGMVDRTEIYRQKAKMAHLYLNPSTTLAALGVHWEKGLVNGAAGQSLVLPLAASNLASTVNIATSAVTAGNEADFLIKASATRRFRRAPSSTPGCRFTSIRMGLLLAPFLRINCLSPPTLLATAECTRGWQPSPQPSPLRVE